MIFVITIIALLAAVAIITVTVIIALKSNTCLLVETLTGFSNRAAITINVNTENFQLLDLPTNGTVEVATETTLIYISKKDYIGLDTFAYKTIDGCKVQNIVICDGKFVQQGSKISGPASSNQGSAVSVSRDGLTLVVGGSNDEGGEGAAWVFTRNSTEDEFIQKGIKLIGVDSSGLANQGGSIALSADGLTLAVGGAADADNVGAVWIFTRNTHEDTFSQRGAKLTPGGNDGASQLGNSVSLSADGLILAAGGSGDAGNDGAVWVFKRTLFNSFTQQGIKLTGSDGSASLQGFSTSISGDGLTLAMGGYADVTNTGATWIFTRSMVTNNFIQQGTKLFADDATDPANQGYSVSLSNDGLVLAVGGNANATNKGATWIFNRTTTTELFIQQGNKLVGDNILGTPKQGTSVSLSSDGLTLAVGGSMNDGGVGRTWIFTRPTLTKKFTQFNKNLLGSGSFGTPNQGQSVGLSGDGLTLVVGNNDNSGAGATWVWDVPPCVA